jgi:arylsulfatase A-like enzyme
MIGIKKRIVFMAVLGGAIAASSAQKPNILWVVSEDNSTRWVGCYGNTNATTPHIDQLAQEGFQYMQAYANGPVCSVSRSSLITGICAVSMGTHNMRSAYNIPHEKIRYYPDFLREAGYFASNGPKTDYNIGGRGNFECWDKKVTSYKEVDWAELKQKQPFIQVINYGASHESQAKFGLDNTRHTPATVHLRKYHPDLPIIRKNYARYLDCVENIDTQIGETLNMLKEAGLADDTIVVYCSDHGGVMPRSKRFLFQEGLHAPLVVYIPPKFKKLWPAKPGTKIDRLVSFNDIPKTFLAISGAKIPSYMQGRVFLGAKTEPESAYHFAFRGRIGESIENARSINDKHFLYIRNYQPFTPWMQKDNYMWEIPATKAWDDFVQSGKATEEQSRWFKSPDCAEELYDTLKDPDCVQNLVNNPEYAETLKQMRKALARTQKNFIDAGLLPECEMVRIAIENHCTIYDVARNPNLYDTATLLELADLALAKDPVNQGKLLEMLENSDPAVRYWGMTGCLLLNLKGAGEKCIHDEWQTTRALAAWLCIKTGNKKLGYQTLTDLINSPSYADLFEVNVLNWMGEDAKPLLDTLEKMPHKPFVSYYGSWFSVSRNENEQRMQHTILTRYNHASPPLPEYGRYKKKGK